jgi:hypothetical protein
MGLINEVMKDDIEISVVDEKLKRRILIQIKKVELELTKLKKLVEQNA